jgi:muramidase (phage lysozyme)
MATDEERLVVSLEARIRDFEKQMDRAAKAGSKSFDSIEKRAKVSAATLEKSLSGAAAGIGKGLNAALSAFGGGFAGALIGGGLSGVIANLGEISRGIAEVGDKAKMTGLSNKAFQELAFVASQNRIEVDALADGMKELQLRGDEWIKTGSGGGAESFQRLGFSATELASRLKDPSALLVEIIRRVQTLDKAAQIRIFDELFGGQGGEKFVQLIAQGADGVQATIDRANELGAVMSDEVIAKAAEIDREFNAISATVATGLKSEIIEVVRYFGELLDKLNQLDQQSNANIQRRLVQVYAGREKLKERIAADEAKSAANPDNVVLLDQLEGEKAKLEELTDEAMKLRDILDERAGWKSGENVVDEATAAKDRVDRLGTALGGTVNGATAGSTAMRTFADAIRALKDEIPDLAKELANLDAKAKIESVYASALRMASTPAELLAASNLHDTALAALAGKDTKAAASKGMLDLIGLTEGTDRGRGYNEVLGYGAFTGGPVNLTTMTLDDVMALQGRMLADPANSFHSSAVGRYQITKTTLADLMGRLGLKGDELYDPAMQDRLAEELLRQSGGDPAKLRGRWTSLKGVDDATISQAYGQSSLSLGNMDPGLKQQATAYAELVANAKQYVAVQQQEQQAVGQTKVQAATLRYEQSMLAEAQRAGIQLAPEQRNQLHELAAAMAEAEQATERTAKAQEGLNQAKQFFGSTIANAFTGLITGAQSFDQVLQQVINSLIQAAIQGALLGEGPLGSLFGGGGGILGAIFGFARGGVVQAATGGHIVGPGTGTSDSIPALLSNGEFVINSAATRKHRALLEAINSGTILGFADGGAVSPAAPSLPRAKVVSGDGATGNLTVQNNITVNGSAGTPEQNADLAQKTAKAAEQSVRKIVVEEMYKQRRQGGILSR